LHIVYNLVKSRCKAKRGTRHFSNEIKEEICEAKIIPNLLQSMTCKTCCFWMKLH
jgi:hypothetical protein